MASGTDLPAAQFLRTYNVETQAWNTRPVLRASNVCMACTILCMWIVPLYVSTESGSEL